MARTTYVIRDSKLVEKHLAAPLGLSSGLAIQPDIEPFVSPIDGSVIGSRSKLREHCRIHDVVPTRELEGLPTKHAVQEVKLSPQERQERREFIAHQVEQKFRR